MNKTTVAQQAVTTNFLPRAQGMLQRKCACGSHTVAGGECAECRKKTNSLQRKQTSGSSNDHPVREADRVAGQVIAAPARPVNVLTYTGAAVTGFESGHYPLKTSSLQNGFTHPVHRNSAVDEESIGDEPDSGGSGQEFPGQLLPSSLGEIPAAGEELMPGIEPLDEGNKKKAKCPSKTVVEKTIDMTPDGIKKGYRTGYGATAVMQVQPDSANWDGTQIVESLKQTKNTCPEEFKISPCSGNSTFTVGAEANSSVLGKLEAKRNRFYDFHISRWNKGSLLHDRNPADIDSCQVECEQSYSCDSGFIGKHTVTRTFTKGKSGSRDVTLVAVTKK